MRHTNNSSENFKNDDRRLLAARPSKPLIPYGAMSAKDYLSKIGPKYHYVIFRSRKFCTLNAFCLDDHSEPRLPAHLSVTVGGRMCGAVSRSQMPTFADIRFRVQALACLNLLHQVQSSSFSLLLKSDWLKEQAKA